MQYLNLDSNIPDQLLWQWCSSSCYSSKLAYLALFNDQTCVLGAKEAWKIRAPNEVWFFVWLAVQNRCWTTERLHRHGMHSDSICALCDQPSETIDHLLLACVVSRQIWFIYFGKYDLVHLLWQIWLATPFTGVERCVPRTVDPQVAKARRKAFDSLCALVARCIWLHLNDVFLGVLDHLCNWRTFGQLVSGRSMSRLSLENSGVGPDQSNSQTVYDTILKKMLNYTIFISE
jgi:hypothetical protein